MSAPTLSPEELADIKKSRKIRRNLAKRSHFWFFSIYLNHYLGFPFAPFHHEMFASTENIDQKLTVLVAFRGSGKSTLMSLSYPIWSIIGVQKKKFVLLVSQTQSQARLLLTNIKKELETNELLKADIGPFQEEGDEWGSNSIVLSDYDARIAVASTETSIRGIRHKQYRPDLVICDDIEDLSSAKTKEGRAKTFRWLTGEVMPIGDQSTKLVIVGNLLHEDCLLMRLKAGIDEEKLRGKFHAFPLVDEDGHISWPGKFSSQEMIDDLKSSIGNESAWYREYLLKIISDEDRLVKLDWIQYYDLIPENLSREFRYISTGIDLAISEKESADCTAMVSAKVYGSLENLKVFILPNPVNRRMDFPTTFNTAKELSHSLGGGHYTKLFIEDVGYQSSLVQQLVRNNVPAEGVLVHGQDKQARLTLITHLVQQGKVLFPRRGAEELISQLTGFGIEKHDDLADAFSLLLLKIMDNDKSGPNIRIICTGSIYDHRWSGNSPFSGTNRLSLLDKW